MHKENYDILEQIFKDKNFYEIYKTLKKTKNYDDIDARLKFVEMKNRDIHDEPTVINGGTCYQDSSEMSNPRIFKISKNVTNKENLNIHANPVAGNILYVNNDNSGNSFNSLCTLKTGTSVPGIDGNFLANFNNAYPNFNFNTKQNVNYVNFNVNQPPFLSWNTSDHFNYVNQLRRIDQLGMMHNLNAPFQQYANNLINPQIMSMIMSQYAKNNELQMLNQIFNNCTNL